MIEDTYGQTPPFLRIQYRDTVFDVPFTSEHRQQVLSAVARMRAVTPGDLCQRSHQIPAKCRSCGHRHQCNQAL